MVSWVLYEKIAFKTPDAYEVVGLLMQGVLVTSLMSRSLSLPLKAITCSVPWCSVQFPASGPVPAPPVCLQCNMTLCSPYTVLCPVSAFLHVFCHQCPLLGAFWASLGLQVRDSLSTWLSPVLQLRSHALGCQMLWVYEGAAHWGLPLLFLC